MHPLEETLSRLGPLGLGLTLAVPPGRPTVLADRLIQSEAELSAHLGRFSATMKVDDQVVASQFSKHWATSVARTALAAYATERRVPDVAASNSAVVFDGAGRPTGLQLLTPRVAALPADPASSDPTAVVVPDEAGLRDWFRTRMFGGHLDAVVDATAAVAPIGRQRLWGNVAAACASAFSVLSTRQGNLEDLMSDATALLDAPDAPTRGLVHLIPVREGDRTRLFVRRETCCLRYRLRQTPASCLSCPLVSERERRRRVSVGLRQPEV